MFDSVPKLCCPVAQCRKNKVCFLAMKFAPGQRGEHFGYEDGAAIVKMGAQLIGKKYTRAFVHDSTGIFMRGPPQATVNLIAASRG
jgi:hypothetical protein